MFEGDDFDEEGVGKGDDKDEDDANPEALSLTDLGTWAESQLSIEDANWAAQVETPGLDELLDRFDQKE